MKKYSEMYGDDLRRLLGINSVVDRSDEAFDRWDKAHPDRDYYRADDRRRELINAFSSIGFCGDVVDEDIIELHHAIMDMEDAYIIARELVNYNTMAEVFVDVTYPEDYIGVDGYVFAAQIEFAHNIFGDCADEDEILACFSSDYKEPF